MQYDFELNNTLPNQIFTTKINNVEMKITVKTGGSNDNPITYFALQIGDEYLCPFVPVFANQKILPYPYMASELNGNFFFETDGEEYPYYENFNDTCKLVFITLDEING